MKKILIALLFSSCIHAEKPPSFAFNIGDKVRVKNTENSLGKLGLVGAIVDIDDDKNDCYPDASYTVIFSVNVKQGVLEMQTVLCPQEIILQGR